MDTKAQITTNIVLALCFAFAVYLNIDTNKKLKRIVSMVELIEMRDVMYVKARNQFLQNLEADRRELHEATRIQLERLND